MVEKVNCNTSVAVLLATYNGIKYLPELLDSLLAQSYCDFTVFIHDDGSNDGTQALLKDYADSNKQIVILDYESQHGAKENFFSLLKRVEAPYYMFCDQDDIWHADKIEKALLAVSSKETEVGKDLPVCVYSDLRVIDENRNLINESFFEMEGIYPEFLEDFNHAGASNFATGCTMLFNHKAKDVMHPKTELSTMHDSWIALSVMKYGGVVFPIREALIEYRQHSSNTLGAMDAKRLTICYRIKNARSIISLLWRHYKMHRALGYGSILKFIYYKIVYRNRINRVRS